MFCTTFPCHNCAKHIIAAGIEEVVYVEPYPKSKALDLFPNAISLEKDKEVNGRKLVRFRPFIGVGPRQFFDLFSMALSAGPKLRRKQKDGTPVAWKRKEALPRVKMLPVTHEQFEKLAAIKVQTVMNQLGERK
jgi:hypothetical protein